MTSPDECGYWRVQVDVISASELLSKDSNGFSDPYVKLSLACDHFRQLQKTRCVTRTLNPTWEQQFVFYAQYERAPVLFTLWDRDLMSRDDFLGSARLDVSKFRDEEFHEVDLHLQRVLDFDVSAEPVAGSLKLRVRLTRLEGRRPEVLCGYDFQAPFDANSRFRKAELVDSGSGAWSGGFTAAFKNLETDNVVQTLGMKPGSYAGKFSGFNYTEAPKNPLCRIAQWSISLWFKTDDPTQDHVLLSAMTTDPEDIHLEKNEVRPDVRVSEYGRSSKGKKSKGPAEATKTFMAGFAIGTKCNLFYDNFGRSMVGGNVVDVATDYSIFVEHFRKKRKKKRRKKKKGKKSASSAPPADSAASAPSASADEDSDWNRSEYFKAGEWNHLVVTYDGASVKEYINGIHTDDKRASFEFVGYAPKLQVGGWDNDMAFKGFKGLLDDIRIYGLPLGLRQIEKMYREGLVRDLE